MGKVRTKSVKRHKWVEFQSNWWSCHNLGCGMTRRSMVRIRGVSFKYWRNGVPQEVKDKKVPPCH